MRRALLLICGGVVALAAAAGPPSAPSDNKPPMLRAADVRAARANKASPAQPASAPRGDLRNDIENNARARGELPHSPPPRQSR
jgi:hypothetical protein